MKVGILPLAILASSILVSCNNNKGNEINTTTGEINSEVAKTGTFSFDGKTVSGKVETQYFGDKEKGNFSVLCQHNQSSDPGDANFELLQITFNNEKEATAVSNLKVYDNGSTLPMTEPEPGIVAVSLSGVGNGLGNKEYTGTEKTTGTITVKNRSIEIKELVLFDSDGDRKTVNATLPF